MNRLRTTLDAEQLRRAAERGLPAREDADADADPIVTA